jgi:hypothetical protein
MSDAEITTLKIGNRPPPTLDRLHALLALDPETGDFHWKVQRGRARAGDLAGHAHHTGFRRIGIDGGSYRADRLAGLYVDGGGDNFRRTSIAACRIR